MANQPVVRALLFIVCFLGGYFLGGTLYAAYEDTIFVVAEWKEEPVVLICSNSKMPENRLEIAVKYWEKFQHKVAFYHKESSEKKASTCDQDFVDGFILIKHGKTTGKTIAYTRRKILSGKILAAVIVIPNDEVFLENLLEHEMGHAFGFSHFEKPGHIMHPTLSFAGKNFWIPD